MSSTHGIGPRTGRRSSYVLRDDQVRGARPPVLPRRQRRRGRRDRSPPRLRGLPRAGDRPRGDHHRDLRDAPERGLPGRLARARPPDRGAGPPRCPPRLRVRHARPRRRPVRARPARPRRARDPRAHGRVPVVRPVRGRQPVHGLHRRRALRRVGRPGRPHERRPGRERGCALRLAPREAPAPPRRHGRLPGPRGRVGLRGRDPRPAALDHRVRAQRRTRSSRWTGRPSSPRRPGS